MSQNQAPRPLNCRHRNRLLAVRVMLNALKQPKVKTRDLLDDDEVFATLVGARRHARLRAAADAGNETGDAPQTDDWVREHATRHLRECERALIDKTRDRQDCLGANTAALARRLGLDRTETKILDFAVRGAGDESVAEAIHELRQLNAFSCLRILARILGCRRERVRRALDETSLLVQSGLIKMETHRGRGMRLAIGEGLSGLELMPGLADALMAPAFDFERVFAPFFRNCGKPKLDLSHFHYLADEIRVLRALLAGSVRGRRRGVQVLLYGPPGTGKTQLAHALAQSIGATLYAVAFGDAMGRPYDRDDRFRGFRLAQQALRKHRKSVLVFDEVEDVFDAPLGWRSEARRDKGWTNDLLEQAAVPTIWITNRTGCIDNAYLRRFSLVLEIDRPPRSVRRQIAADYLGEYGVKGPVLDRIAEARSITPADLDRTQDALRLGESLREDSDTASKAAVTLLGSGPRGPGVSALQARDTFRLPAFDPALVNTDLDLDRVLAGLEQSGEGRLCLYGQPGTGKTAFAKYVANYLSRDLITVSASDWLAPFVGMTEQLIRNSFDQAQRENAVLFVDEADNFLRDRSLATRSWQVTQVNELLKCLEDAQGIVMLATNAFDALDPAVLRRLDVKAAFRPLNWQQAAVMFRQTFVLNARNDACAGSIDAAIDQLGQLNGLVNGDFAAACRRLHVSAQPFIPQALLDALADELRLRDRHQRTAIGFAAPVE